MHWFEFNKHIKSAHKNKPNFHCTLCDTIIPKKSGDIDLRHFSDHGFSLCTCVYCSSFVSNDTESMRCHLRDVHPMRLAYALVRISNSSANSHQQASIIQFEDTKCSFKFLPLTETQLNFMRPALQSPFNGYEPALPHINISQVVEQNRMKFIQFYQFEAANAESIKKKL